MRSRRSSAATIRGCWSDPQLRAVVQRVHAASVEVGRVEVARIGPGVAVLVGIGASDNGSDATRLAGKVAGLRIFSDDGGGLRRSLAETAGAILAVSQFTLYGDLRRGRRPDMTGAAPPQAARALFDRFCEELRATGAPVATGEFGAAMRVLIDGDGPVTIVLSTDGWEGARI